MAEGRDELVELLEGAAGPRALDPALRAHLESALLAPPAGAGAGDAAPAADPVGVLLARAQAPRPLSPEVRSALMERLGRGERRTGWVAAAAASVVLVAVAAVALRPADAPAPSAGPAPSPGLTATASPSPRVGAAAPQAPPVLGAPPASGPSASPAPAPGRPQAPAPAQPGAAGPNAGRAEQTGVTRVSPPSGPLVGGTRITVSGRGLSGVVRVEVGGRAATGLRVESDRSLSAATPSAAESGAVQVVVVTRDGGRYGLSPGFRYLDVPVLSAVEPSSGPRTGGTTVVLRGAHFTRSATVRFGDEPAKQVQWVSTTELRAVTPPHLPGPADVTVTTAGGTSEPRRYLYLA